MTGAARLLAWSCALVALLAVAPARGDAPSVDPREAAARLAAGGFVMMMRHARTEPGVGDPPSLRVEDCSTQRNLSEAGREQSRRAGEALRSLGVRIDVVRSSRWCRCRDTARLAFGAYQSWPALDSFFGRPGEGAARTAEIAAFARDLRGPGNAMLVTHQVNISAALGGFAAPGEIVVGRWRDGGLRPEFRFTVEAVPPSRD
ncbi:MAG TPA: histidine phosphatase family protein [Zeimonas sp.]|nr:histidine phosphatase family protein [Zeimonas sp.]